MILERDLRGAEGIIEDNLFIVMYCVEEMHRMGREVVMVAIDFEKASDSVGRLALARALQFYKCHQKLIY